MKKLVGTGKIFEEIQVGTMRVPNRIVAAPFCTRLATVEGYASPELIDYWRERAAGGAGLVIVEASFVDKKCSRMERNQLGVFSDDCHVGLAVLAESIKNHGARAALQLHHGGLRSKPHAIWGPQPLGPSSIRDPRTGNLLAKEMTVEDIEEVTDSFSRSAKRAKTVGFDAIELHFAHGYLICSFLSPHFNKRQDEYGGNLKNRARFALEIIERCRKEIGPEFPIGVRITADEYMEGGITLTESRMIAKWFEEAGTSYIHVSASCGETLETQCPTIYQSKGFLVHLAVEIRKEVDIPVIAVAAITPRVAVRVIEKDKADLVAFGRGLNADPSLPKKMAEGREAEIVPCIRCNRCMEAEGRELTTRCETNFLTGRSQSYPILPARRPRKVVVVGGGPGGLEAARVAALRGCKVKLYDENDRLGGALVAASIPQFMEEFRRVIDYYETQLKRLDVEVVLHRRISPADTHADQPDSLILALGARPITPMVPGKDKPIVGHAIDALLGKIEFGDRVLLIGGNFISCQIAAHLAQQDREVTLVTQRRQESQLAGELERFSQRELIRMLKKLRVKAILGHRLSEIIDGGGIFQTGEVRNVVFEVDNILLSLGYLPKRQELKEFMGHAQLVHAVGDCVRPRRMGPAIWEGFIAGYEA